MRDASAKGRPETVSVLPRRPETLAAPVSSGPVKRRDPDGSVLTVTVCEPNRPPLRILNCPLTSVSGAGA